MSNWRDSKVSGSRISDPLRALQDVTELQSSAGTEESFNSQQNKPTIKIEGRLKTTCGCPCGEVIKKENGVSRLSVSPCGRHLSNVQ